MRYAGLSTQVAVSVGVAVWLGVKADKWLKLSFPIFSLVVPLLVIVFVLVELIKANTGKKDEKIEHTSGHFYPFSPSRFSPRSSF